MRYVLLIFCLLSILGCEAGTGGGFYGFNPMPPIYQPYSFGLPPMEFHSIHGGTFEADGVGGWLRQREMDDMLWQHQHGGASFPFNQPPNFP